jgi:hypothetical protein
VHRPAARQAAVNASQLPGYNVSTLMDHFGYWVGRNLTF